MRAAMRRFLRHLVPMLACVLCLLAAAGARADPFSAGSPNDAPAQVAPPGLVRGVMIGFVRLQRDINRALTDSVAGLKRDGSPGAIALCLAIAFAYGVFHAVGPGHGKAVILSYFLSREARIMRGVWMGSQIAFFHVVSAIVIVLLVHWLLDVTVAQPVDQLQFLKLGSYGAIAAIGVFMLVGAVRRLGIAGEIAKPDHDHHHACGAAHSGESGFLSFAVGLIPCSGAVLILVYALANGLLVAGILMTLCIAVGMAMTLSVIGIAAVYARARAVGAPEATEARRPRVRMALDLLGPLIVTLFGAILLAATLAQPN
jgi:ABC-type nickel/cobalt efflux system permease component RcnA